MAKGSKQNSQQHLWIRRRSMQKSAIDEHWTLMKVNLLQSTKQVCCISSKQKWWWNVLLKKAVNQKCWCFRQNLFGQQRHAVHLVRIELLRKLTPKKVSEYDQEIPQSQTKTADICMYLPADQMLPKNQDTLEEKNDVRELSFDEDAKKKYATKL